MELHQLEYFLAVAGHLHFTRAAEALHVAQPSVSQQIRKLEDELGVRLFHRMKRRVALTPAGETLLPWARRVLGDIAEARAEVQELTALRRGRLAVGAPPSVSTTLLPHALASFHDAYPGVSLTLREAGSGDLIRYLEQGELDLAAIILPAGHPALETTPLLDEELVLAVPPGHELAGLDVVELAALRDVPLVMFREGYDLREATMTACRQAGFEPRLALDGGEMDSVLRCVEAGLGVAVVPSMVIRSEGALGAVRLAPTLTRTIALANRRDRPLSRAARELILHLKRADGRASPRDSLRGTTIRATPPAVESR
jgi:DNA-binding transcriptional LysR family regulator